MTIMDTEGEVRDMTVAAKAQRAKISTTVASENKEYIHSLVKAGEIKNESEALDRAIALLRRARNRHHLAVATANYFDSMSAQARADENEMAEALAAAAGEIDFDREP